MRLSKRNLRARWYPPSAPHHPSSDDGILPFQQQKTTGQPNPKTFDSIDPENEEIDEKLRKIKQPKKEYHFDKEDIIEYVDSLNVPRYDSSYFGPSYGHPDFLSSANKLKRIYK